jgi:hypothetical protein
VVWKQDLAKLRQDLKTQEANSPVPAVAPPAKSTQQPVTPRPLEEEDALFLATVGKVTANTTKPAENPAEPVEFEEAMSKLGGLKLKASGMLTPLSAERLHRDSKTGEQLSWEKSGVEMVSQSESEIQYESAAIDNNEGHTGREYDEDTGAVMSFPEKIQLAAGMTIEVDGQIDLRNHNAEDARERLKERVLDGQCLGWRSLHVILGNSKQLHQAFIDYINSPQSHSLTKYAQAPIPMGGAQAWILYYSNPV